MAEVNPFAPTTTGGTAGSFVYNDLTTKQNYDNRTVALNRAAKLEAEVQTKLNNYVVVVKALDQDILDRLQIINNKKQEIVTIIDDVFTNYSDSNPLRTSKSFTDTVADKVVYMAGISTFTYGTPTGNPPVYPIGVRGQVYPDIIAAWHYPNLDTLDVDKVFYKDGEKFITVTNANLGVGVTAYEFGNAAGATGIIGLVTTSNASLGYYYFWSNLSSVDAGAATSISNIVTEIELLRVGINSSLTDTVDGDNKVRGLKSQIQVDLWFEKKGQRSVNIADYPGAIDNLDDNATIIQNYNS